jgi:hypothetical protein
MTSAPPLADRVVALLAFDAFLSQPYEDFSSHTPSDIVREFVRSAQLTHHQGRIVSDITYWVYNARQVDLVLSTTPPLDHVEAFMERIYRESDCINTAVVRAFIVANRVPLLAAAIAVDRARISACANSLSKLAVRARADTCLRLLLQSFSDVNVTSLQYKMEFELFHGSECSISTHAFPRQKHSITDERFGLVTIEDTSKVSQQVIASTHENLKVTAQALHAHLHKEVYVYERLLSAALMLNSVGCTRVIIAERGTSHRQEFERILARVPIHNAATVLVNEFLSH